ncbi:MAG: FGGY-family carbohydrate kinase [Saccharofermentanales bacterium]
MAIIGLDVGSTGCKCIVFSDAGHNEAYSYEEYPRSLTGTTIPAETIWQSVCSVLKDANRKFSQRNDDAVKAICISSFGESFVPVDETGKPLADIMLYTDPRGQEECDRFLDVMPEDEIMRISGVKPQRMYSLPKIAWIRAHQPDVFNKTWKFLLVEDYIIYRLCGSAIIDYSLASRTMAFDVTLKCWDPGLLSLAGINSTHLSDPVPSGTIAGIIFPVLADEFGFTKDVRIVTGGHDQVCAAVGAGVTAPGTAIDGIGTVECITPAFSQPILEPEFLQNNYACVPYAVPGMYVTYAFNFTGGALLKWFRDNFAAKEEIEARASGKSVYQILDEKAAPSPSQLLVIPHFAGSGTPDMDPAATGSIIGLSFKDGVPEIYRALLEGVTFEMKYNMDLLQSVGVNIVELRAVGGGAKSKIWLEIKAAITGCRILQLEVDEAGITGAAILASVAMGIYPSIKEASDKFIKIKDTIEPDKALQEKYVDLYTQYKKYRDHSFK